MSLQGKLPALRAEEVTQWLKYSWCKSKDQSLDPRAHTEAIQVWQPPVIPASGRQRQQEVSRASLLSRLAHLASSGSARDPTSVNQSGKPSEKIHSVNLEPLHINTQVHALMYPHTHTSSKIHKEMSTLVINKKINFYVIFS